MYTIPYALKRGKDFFPEEEVVGLNERKTFAEIYESSKKLIPSLKDYGIEEGDTVAVADLNTVKNFELLNAVTGSRSIFFPVNVNLPTKQIAYTLKKTDSKYLLYSKPLEDLVEVFEGEKAIPLDEINPSEKGGSFDAKQNDTAIALVTGGTTGLPKVARYTHRKMFQGALSIAHQLSHYKTPAELSEDDVIFPQIPMFHILAWGTPLIAPYKGSKLIMGGKFDPEIVAKFIETERASWINAVPTMMDKLLKSDADLEGLKALVGGSVITEDLANKMEGAGVNFSSIYGGTDMLAASISIMTPEAKSKGGSYIREVTHPAPSAEFKVESLEKGSEEDEKGEVYFKAPWLPDGYYKDEEKTKEAFTDDNWFRTGDIGVLMPDGGIKILGRTKDAIKSGGEWIPTGVLESAISEVEEVKHVAVIPKPDEEWGERPVAVVSPVKQKNKPSEEEIRNHLNEKVDKGEISDWWIPDEVFHLKEMPFTSTEKIDKKKVREQIEF